MPDRLINIFISYAHNDSVFVDRLEADLRSQGFGTWLDRRGLAGGQKWRRELQEAIDHSSVMLVVLSPDAVTSQYVQSEYGYAIDEGKIVIPLSYRPCKVPMDLRSIQWIDFQHSYEGGLATLLHTLQGQSDTSPLPASSEENQVDQSGSPPSQPHVKQLLSSQPTGTVTFLFTDIEGSTKRWEEHPEAMGTALAHHDALLRAVITVHGGFVFKTVGDAVYAAFASPTDAVAAAVTVQQAVAAEQWGEVGPLWVRMALHTGAAESRDDDYFGPTVNRVARLLATSSGGQVLLSATTHELTRDSLPEGVYLKDLGEHALKDLLQPEHIYQLVLPNLPSEFLPLKSLSWHAQNLPVQATPFVGRKREVTSVCDQLGRPDVRLITLTGPGGIGKTRLGLQVAAELLNQFADGVFLVQLAPVTDPEQVIPTIIQDLGISNLRGQAPLTLLKAVLKDKQMLLLLDNFEQVVDAAVQVAELLATCPKIKVLVTSRVVLHLQAEREFVVPPLQLPNPKRLPNLTSLSQYEAVVLFIQRAQAVKPDFALTGANAPAVVAICARLDGLPLAIELAAARVKYFPPQVLLTRLEQGLGVLSGGARDLPPRQQTLRGAIAWSYDLLSPQEQTLFRRLAVFVNDCSSEAAEAVCQAAGELEIDVLEGLLSLVDKSLLRQEEAEEGEPRFRMLEVLREFGLEMLTSAGEAEATQHAHAAYYQTLSEQAEPHLKGAEQLFWLQRLDREQDNLRAALGWQIGHKEVEMALRFCTALWLFWQTRGYWSEGRRWLKDALALQGTEERTALRAKALSAAGELAALQGDVREARQLLSESVSLYRELGDERGLVVPLPALGWVMVRQGEAASAGPLMEESTALSRKLGRSWELSRVLFWSGYNAWLQGDLAQATALIQESLTLARGLGDKILMARSLNNLGYLAWLEGDLAQATILTQEALTLFRELGDKAFIVSTLETLGSIALSQGNLTQAAAFFTEGLPTAWELGMDIQVGWRLMGLARLALAQAQLQRAACLFGAAETKFDVTKELSRGQLSDYERTIASLRDRLGEQAFTAAWAEGRTMTLAQVLEGTAPSAASDP